MVPNCRKMSKAHGLKMALALGITGRQRLLSAMCGARRELVDPGRPIPWPSKRALWYGPSLWFHPNKPCVLDLSGGCFIWGDFEMENLLVMGSHQNSPRKTHYFSATNPPGPSPVWTMGQKLKRLPWVFQWSKLLRPKLLARLFQNSISIDLNSSKIEEIWTSWFTTVVLPFLHTKLVVEVFIGDDGEPLVIQALVLIPIPIGSMYAIYGNMYHQYTPNVSIYTIHGSYGIQNVTSFHIQKVGMSP